PDRGKRTAPNQRRKLTGAAILVFRASAFLQAAPAAWPSVPAARIGRIDRGECRTDARWLELVRPGLAIASLGRGKGVGHPGSETPALLARSDIAPLRTDVDGTRGPERRPAMVGRRQEDRREGTARAGREDEAQAPPRYEAGRSPDRHQHGDQGRARG